MLDLAVVTIEDFRPHLGSTFTLSAGAETLDLKLVEATEFSVGRPGVRRGFSLMFGGGTVERIVPQATYVIRHPVLGEFELFIVPRTPVDGEPRYEATFN